MYQKSIATIVLTCVLTSQAFAHDTSHSAMQSTSPVQPVPSVDNIPNSDATSTLFRFKSSIKFDIQTSGLDPNTPYTLWAVIFNSPQYCLTQPCTIADIPFSPGHDARVEASMVFAGGGMSDADGDGRFVGRVRKAFGRAMGEIVVGTGELNTRKAEVHAVIRGHGNPAPDDALAALNSMFGGCTAQNICEDQQFAIHAPGGS